MFARHIPAMAQHVYLVCLNVCTVEVDGRLLYFFNIVSRSSFYVKIAHTGTTILREPKKLKVVGIVSTTGDIARRL